MDFKKCRILRAPSVTSLLINEISVMSVAIPKISKLSSAVSRILGCNPGPMTLQGTNTYIVGSGDRRVLIDCGDGESKEYLENLENFQKSEGFTISDIIVTHWHHDHIGGVKPILQHTAPNARVYKFLLPSESGNDPYLPIQDGQVFKVMDGITLKALHTPGHTQDHIILHHEEDNAIFGGDCVLGEGTAVFEDLKDYLESLKSILQLCPNVIYPGHGPVISDPLSKLEYYIAHRKLREEQILRAFKKNFETPLSAMDVVKIVYTDTPEHLHIAAANNVTHHLNKLVKDLLLERLDEERFCLKTE